MAEMFDSSEPDNKMRVGQVTTLAVGLEAESGNELVATRHRGSPLSDDVGRLCAAPLSGDNARTLTSGDCKTAVHFSGGLASRFLPSKAQSTDDDDNAPTLSSLTFSKDDPTTAVLSQQLPLHSTGHDPGRPYANLLLVSDETPDTSLCATNAAAPPAGQSGQLGHANVASLLRDTGLDNPGRSSRESAHGTQ